MVSFPMYVKQQNSEISKNSEEDTLESENLKDELKNELESSFDILATNVSDIAAATGTELEGITKQENAALTEEINKVSLDTTSTVSEVDEKILDRQKRERELKDFDSDIELSAEKYLARAKAFQQERLANATAAQQEADETLNAQRKDRKDLVSKATKEAQAEAAGAMAATMELVRRFNLTISSEESTLARKLARALKLSAGRTAQEKALMQRDLSGVFAKE